MVHKNRNPRIFKGTRLTPTGLRLTYMNTRLIAGLTTRRLMTKGVRMLTLSIPRDRVSNHSTKRSSQTTVLTPRHPLMRNLPSRLDTGQVRASGRLYRVTSRTGYTKAAGTMNRTNFAIAASTSIHVSPTSSKTILLTIYDQRTRRLSLYSLREVTSFFCHRKRLGHDYLFLPVLVTDRGVSARLFDYSLDRL